MSEVGVRELKAKASEILLAVREQQARYTITYRGEPVAVLLPIEQAPEQKRDAADVWAELDRLSEEIFANRESDKTLSELITEMRR